MHERFKRLDQIYDKLEGYAEKIKEDLAELNKIVQRHDIDIQNLKEKT